MRFEGTRPGAKDPQVPVYLYAMSKQEAKLIHDVVLKFVKDTKGIFEVSPVRNRARNIVSRIELSIKE